MDGVAQLPRQKREELFNETAARLGMTPFIVEKDFWVCWTLKQVFQDESLSKLLMFKGGTSLSKVFNLIKRFSEDIDLILDWNVVIGDENPLDQRSKTKQRTLNEAINEEAVRYIAAQLLPQLNHVVKPVCECQIDDHDPLVVNVLYPALFSDDYLRPVVRLEIGPLAAWLPFDEYSIRPYSADVFPNVFDKKECRVNAIVAERTFWEKATILHHEAHRPEGSIQPLRYSRHYYDLAMMAGSDVKQKALSNLDMLAAVVDFKKRFYDRGWAHYDFAKPGTLRLIPEDHVLRVLRKDYVEMQQMIFGESPSFDEMMTILAELETEINKENHS
ncbi:MAG: nucleotidyl transferase AbiEii/AbiGii toxin family protein [Gammaproteobacteria bacterium]|nr:nucleotidyl transferase AbiEii/AbiGii toxin family protein [Gammaproteobacteria bacterium]